MGRKCRKSRIKKKKYNPWNPFSHPPKKCMEELWLNIFLKSMYVLEQLWRMTGVRGGWEWVLGNILDENIGKAWAMLKRQLFYLTERSSKLFKFWKKLLNYGEDESSSTLTRTEVRALLWGAPPKGQLSGLSLEKVHFILRFPYFFLFFQANYCFSMAPSIQSKLRTALCNCFIDFSWVTCVPASWSSPNLFLFTRMLWNETVRWREC